MDNLEYILVRHSSGNESTLGLLFDPLCNFISYTLEDKHRTVKVYGETRIPAGRYEIKLRTVGGFHDRYSKKFPEFHEGMLQIMNVPEFQYVLIHIGNTDDDTAGCVLVGRDAYGAESGGGTIGNSTTAYKHIYPMMLNDIKKGHKVFLNIKDSADALLAHV